MDQSSKHLDILLGLRRTLWISERSLRYVRLYQFLFLPFVITMSPLVLWAAQPSTSLTYLSDDAKGNIHNGQRIAILLSGNDSELIKIVEDGLAIHLIKAAFKVNQREELERALAQQISSKEQSGGALGTIEIAKAVKAKFVLSGTVFVDISESKALLIKEASLHLTYVGNGQTILRALFEWNEGGSLSDLGAAFLKLLDKARE